MTIEKKLDLCEQHKFTQLCEFCEESFGKKHALYAYLTYKDVNSFRNGSVDEFYNLKASRLAKFILVVTDTSDVEKIKNRCEQNFEVEANKQ